jgi:hypothetical protein
LLESREARENGATKWIAIRDAGAPRSPYFGTLPRFETAVAKYSFLNRLLAVGTGEIRADGPVHVIEELL